MHVSVNHFLGIAVLPPDFISFMHPLKKGIWDIDGDDDVCPQMYHTLIPFVYRVCLSVIVFLISYPPIALSLFPFLHHNPHPPPEDGNNGGLKAHYSLNTRRKISILDFLHNEKRRLDEEGEAQEVKEEEEEGEEEDGGGARERERGRKRGMMGAR